MICGFAMFSTKDSFFLSFACGDGVEAVYGRMEKSKLTTILTVRPLPRGPILDIKTAAATGC